MPNANHSNGGESALVVALNPQYTPFVDVLPPGGSVDAPDLDPNTWAGLNHHFNGQLFPAIVSSLSSIVMYAATGVVIYEAAEHLTDIVKRTVVVSMLVVLFPFAFLSYRKTIQFGCLCSGIVFLAFAVLMPVPMSVDMRWLFAIGSTISLAASVWAKESGEQP